MKGDFSRLTFDPAKQFSRVLTQQGRVQLDADWNEQASLLLYHLRTLASAVIGPYGGVEPDALKITAGASDAPRPGLAVGAGNYFVNGILCANNSGTLPFTQPDSGKAANDDRMNAGDYLVYLSVAERHITFVNDDDIREKALGDGVDTASRTKVVATVSAVAVDNLTKLAGDERVKAINKALARLRPGDRAPTMRASLEDPNAKPQDICTVPPFARFRGAGNQLYRVEIHKPSKDSQGNSQVPTFKWSRDNGSVVFPVTGQANGNKVPINRFGRDGRFALQKGDWVEFEDDDLIASGKYFKLARVEYVDSDSVTLDSAPPANFGSNPAKHPLLRRWDHATPQAGATYNQDGIAIQSENRAYPLEQGIQVEFKAEGHDYLRGDYWVIPARTLTGSIDWPDKQYLPARRAEGGVAPLAAITIDASGRLSGTPTDLRSLIQPIAKPVF
ncbi:MAG TPA: DUF6519 domain-containing protein [Pyrinomonadaceae bacterium]|nr:DUF6519 domain-containing protein [Pyrinomonadaceae bacterium]